MPSKRLLGVLPIVAVVVAGCGAGDRVDVAAVGKKKEGSKPPVLMGNAPEEEMRLIRQSVNERALEYYLNARHQAAVAERQKQAAASPRRASRSKTKTTKAPRPTASTRTYATPSGGWWSLIARYPWNAALAHRIMMCESHGNPNAHNRSGANGLFQILGGPYDPEANVATAYHMYSQRGWQPWRSSRSCWG